MPQDKRISIDPSEIQSDIEKFQTEEPLLAELSLGKAIIYLAKRGIATERDRLAGSKPSTPDVTANLINFLKLVAQGDCPPDGEIITMAETLGVDPELFIQLCPEETVTQEEVANGV